MGKRDGPEPEAWRAYRAATGRDVPAVHRLTMAQRVGLAVVGVTLAAASVLLRDAGFRLPTLLVGLALFASWCAVEQPGPLPGSGYHRACPICGGALARRRGPDGGELAACRACGLARPVPIGGHRASGAGGP